MEVGSHGPGMAGPGCRKTVESWTRVLQTLEKCPKGHKIPKSDMGRYGPEDQFGRIWSFLRTAGWWCSTHHLSTGTGNFRHGRLFWLCHVCVAGAHVTVTASPHCNSIWYSSTNLHEELVKSRFSYGSNFLAPNRVVLQMEQFEGSNYGKCPNVNCRHNTNKEQWLECSESWHSSNEGKTQVVTSPGGFLLRRVSLYELLGRYTTEQWLYCSKCSGAQFKWGQCPSCRIVDADAVGTLKLFPSEDNSNGNFTGASLFSMQVGGQAIPGLFLHFVNYYQKSMNQFALWDFVAIQFSSLSW
jgi:hypothetical protein